LLILIVVVYFILFDIGIRVQRTTLQYFLDFLAQENWMQDNLF
jgi:hypothetical protein